MEKFNLILNNHHSNWLKNNIDSGLFLVSIRNNIDADQFCATKKINPSLYTLFLFQNPRTDWNILFHYIFFRFYKRKDKATLIYLFHGARSRQTHKLIRRLIKYSVLGVVRSLIKIMGGRFAYITEYVSRSFGDRGNVWPQYIHLDSHMNCKTQRRGLAIVANDFWRDQFIKSPDLLCGSLSNGEPIRLFGLGNDRVEFSKLDPKFFSKPDELISALTEMKFIYVGLCEPENWFNLGVLEGMALGLIPVVHDMVEYRIGQGIGYVKLSEVDIAPTLEGMREKNLEFLRANFSVQNLEYSIETLLS